MNVTHFNPSFNDSSGPSKSDAECMLFAFAFFHSTVKLAAKELLNMPRTGGVTYCDSLGLPLRVLGETNFLPVP